MRLTALNPHFYGAGGEGVYQATGNACPVCPATLVNPDCCVCLGRGVEYVPAPERKGVGIGFDCPCPTCTSKRTGDADKDYHLRHYIPFANPIDGGAALESGHPTWQRTGETFEDLRLSPSILSSVEKGGCGWHGHIGLNVPGEVTTC